MRRAVRAIVFKDNNLLVMKRNKFGTHYYTLPGGAMIMGENAEQALLREMTEETSLQLGDARLVFAEDAGDPYGMQYIYLTNYVSGDPKLSLSSDEASISALGQNTYEPVWLPISELPSVNFVSPRLRDAIVNATKTGFPAQPITLV